MGVKIIVGIVIGLLIAVTAAGVAGWWRRKRYLRSGRRGERIVAKELNRLNKREYIVINDMLVVTESGHTSQIDHVVVSTRGIFVIETKNHGGRISGSEHSQYWQQHLKSESKSFYNPLLQNASHIKAIRHLLPRLEKSLFSAMVVFSNAWRIDIQTDEIIKSRTLLPDKHITRTLIPAERKPKRWWRPGKEIVLDENKMATLIDGMLDELTRRPRIIDRNEMQEIADILMASNVKDNAMRQQHTRYVKETARNISTEISHGICPRCGGELVIRKGTNGEFVGCANYPKCRFTCSIDQVR